MDPIEQSARADELNKLRCDSASPSALSTASSGSPLVRGASSSSASATKRPPPTSIAAAQLQFQQQQLEFNNKLAGPNFQPSKLGKQQAARANQNNSATQPQHYDSNYSQYSKQHYSGHEMTYPMAAAAEEQRQKSTAKSHEAGFGAGKSFGYNLAKVVAFRAHRINEFWSISKLHYINLACLLMTLICLATILVFSASGPASSPSPLNLSSQKLLASTDDGFEPIESLDSQRLVRSSRQQNNLTLFDDSQAATPDDDSNIAAKSSSFKRKSETPIDPSADKTTAFNSSEPAKFERELEDASFSSSDAGDRAPADEFDPPVVHRLPHFYHPSHRHLTGGHFMLGSDSPLGMSGGPPPPFLAPMLSSIFNDLDIGSLISKSIKNATANGGKPTVIKRLSKNGATIIISSSGSFNGSSSSDSILPSLLDKLLPPMFSSNGTTNSTGLDGLQSSATGNGGLASATITIASESMPTAFVGSSFPPLASSHSPFGWSSARPFGFQSQLVDSGASRLGVASPFVRFPITRFGPFSQATSPSPSFMMAPPLLPPPGLLSMIMRANSLAEDMGEESAPQNPRNGTQAVNLPRASNQTATTSGGGNSATPNGDAANGSKTPAEDPEVELFDVSHIPRVSRTRQLYGSGQRLTPLGSGSMIVFSSGPFEAGPRSPLLSPASPFMPPPFMSMGGPMQQGIASASTPQMLFMGSGSQDGSAPNEGGEIKPIIRAMLSEVMSDLAERKQAEGRPNRRLDKASNDWADLDDEWASDSDGDYMSAGSKPAPMHLRARHRSSANDEDSPESFQSHADAAELVSGLEMEHSRASEPGSDSFDGGLVSGTIRQTVRGPNGVTSERIIEIPSRPVAVEPGVRSQSISRADLDESADGRVPMFSPPRQQGGFPSINLIGRLMSDLSRRVADRSDGSIKIRSSIDDATQSDETDPSGEQPESMGNRMATPVAQQPARIRVASTRIKTGPVLRLRSPGPLGGASSMPVHFTIPASEPSTSNSNQQEEPLSPSEDRVSHVFSADSAPPANHRPSGQISELNAREKAPLPVFTSPSSPLFGFPIQAARQAASALEPQPSTDVSNERSKPPVASDPITSNREPRMFTYHSNHEIANANQSAPPTAQRRSDLQIQARQPQQPSHSGPQASKGQFPMIGRANRMVDFVALSPPAELVMGRRADDSPGESIFAQESRHQ